MYDYISYYWLIVLVNISLIVNQSMLAMLAYNSILIIQ